jgi:integrase
MKWYRAGSKESGYVYYKKHPTRKHGIKYDKYYRAEYQFKEKRYAINFGWASNGWSELECLRKLQYYKKNAKSGTGPKTLKEEREITKARNEEIERQKASTDAENVSFSAFWTTHYQPFAEFKKSWAAEKSFYKIWLKNAVGKKTLKGITIFELEELKSKMEKAGKSPKTVQHVLATIRQVFNRAINIEVFHGPNPVSKIKFQKLNNKRNRYLNKDEAEKLLETLANKSIQVRDIALLSLHTGMRAAEIFKLNWRDISFDQGTIHLADTKNNESRHAYMSNPVREMLERNLQNKKSDLVFPNAKGNRIKAISNSFSRTVDDLSLNKESKDDRDKVVFHTLRHTFASWQVQGGMDLYTLQRLMGHKSFQMVQRYAHLAPDNLRKATSIFNCVGNDKKIIPFPQKA